MQPVLSERHHDGPLDILPYGALLYPSSSPGGGGAGLGLGVRWFPRPGTHGSVSPVCRGALAECCLSDFAAPPGLSTEVEFLWKTSPHPNTGCFLAGYFIGFLGPRRTWPDLALLGTFPLMKCTFRQSPWPGPVWPHRGRPLTRIPLHF